MWTEYYQSYEDFQSHRSYKLWWDCKTMVAKDDDDESGCGFTVSISITDLSSIPCNLTYMVFLSSCWIPIQPFKCKSDLYQLFIGLILIFHFFCRIWIWILVRRHFYDGCKKCKLLFFLFQLFRMFLFLNVVGIEWMNLNGFHYSVDFRVWGWQKFT